MSLREILCNKSCLILHNFIVLIAFSNKNPLISNGYNTFRCMDYRFKYFMFCKWVQLCFDYSFFLYWPIISISTFINSLWFKFTITSGDAKSNLKFKYIIYDNFISFQNLSYMNIVYKDFIISRFLVLFSSSSGGSILEDDLDTRFDIFLWVRTLQEYYHQFIGVFVL